MKILNCKKLFFLAYKYIHNCKIMRSNKKLPGHRWNMSNTPQQCQHQVIKNVQMNGHREGKAFSQLSDVMMAFQKKIPKVHFWILGIEMLNVFLIYIKIVLKNYTKTEWTLNLTGGGNQIDEGLTKCLSRESLCDWVPIEERDKMIFKKCPFRGGPKVCMGSFKESCLRCFNHIYQQKNKKKY